MKEQKTDMFLKNLLCEGCVTYDIQFNSYTNLRKMMWGLAVWRKGSGNSAPYPKVIELVKAKLELKSSPSDSLNPFVSRCLAICTPWACFSKRTHPAITPENFLVGKNLIVLLCP